MFTSDPVRGFEIARRIRTGTFRVNTMSADFNSSFGGYKESGIGREHGPYAIDEYLLDKTISIEPGEEVPDEVLRRSRPFRRRSESMHYVYANVKVKYGQLPAFFEAMVTVRRVMEANGWKMVGAWSTLIGDLHEVHDLWEVEDANTVPAGPGRRVRGCRLRPGGRAGRGHR